MNQRLLHKDCVAKIDKSKIVTQRLRCKGEDFYGVNLSKNLTTYLVKHLSKNLTTYLMKYLPNPGLRKAFLVIDLEDWCIQGSTYRWSSRSKGCALCGLVKIQNK